MVIVNTGLPYPPMVHSRTLSGLSKVTNLTYSNSTNQRSHRLSLDGAVAYASSSSAYELRHVLISEAIHGEVNMPSSSSRRIGPKC